MFFKIHSMYTEPFGASGQIGYHCGMDHRRAVESFEITAARTRACGQSPTTQLVILWFLIIQGERKMAQWVIHPL